MYFSGQGKIFLGTVGAADVLHVGNVPGLDVALKVEVKEHKESTTGQRLTDMRLITSKSAEIKMTLEDFGLDNLALGLYGVKATRTGASITNESLGTVTAGKVVKLAHPSISSVVLQDSAGTPVTLDAADYSVDEDFGMVTFVDVTGYTMPITANYTYGATTDVVMFTEATPYRRMVANIINTADSNSLYQVELYKVQFDPLGNLPLIQDDTGKLELTGSALVEVGAVYDPVLGYFGRIIKL